MSPVSDRQGRYFLDVRKNNVSGDDYSSLCDDLATTLGSGGWRAHLNIAGTTFDFDCEITPNDTARGSHYVDVRAHTDAPGYKKVMEALAAAATSSPRFLTEGEGGGTTTLPGEVRLQPDATVVPAPRN